MRAANESYALKMNIIVIFFSKCNLLVQVYKRYARSLLLSEASIIAGHKKSQEWFLCLSKSIKNATVSELQGASLPILPPGLCPLPIRGLQQPPDPQLSLAMIFWSLHVVPIAQLPQDWEFFLFLILGLRFWIISMLGTEIRNPTPFRTLF